MPKIKIDLETLNLLTDAQKKHRIKVDVGDKNIQALVRYARQIGYGEGYKECLACWKTWNKRKSLII